MAVIQHVAIATLLSALIYSNRIDIRRILFSREDEAIAGLQSTIASSVPKFQKVAVGVNANVDLVVSSFAVFKKLGIEPSPSSSHGNFDAISSLAELEACFAHHFKKCAAAERYVASRALFQQIVDAASSIDHAQYHVGGNAALMGLNMLRASANSSVLLGGPIGPKLVELLERKLVIPEALRQATDEYHLILEYSKGEVWGEVSSSCANRFILTHDEANGQMLAMDKFFDSVSAFHPDLLVISGLHLLEGQSENVWREKVADLQSHLLSIPSHLPIHLELASMTSSHLMRDIAEHIFPLVDSIGLNEQELAFLSLSLRGPGNEEELRQWPPEIGLMGDVLHWLLNSFGKDRHSKRISRLSRVHFHCLTYHIIAGYPDVWRNSLVAVAAGSEAGSKQACDLDVIDTKHVELRTPEYFARSVRYWELRRFLVKSDEANPVTSWTHDGVDFHFSAVLVCKHPKRTVGLGDCISASGLQHSNFLSN